MWGLDLNSFIIQTFQIQKYKYKRFTEKRNGLINGRGIQLLKLWIENTEEN